MERNNAHPAILAWLLIAALIHSVPVFAGGADRVQGPGFSYVPPSGAGWHVVRRSPTQVLYGKQPSGEMVGGRLTGHYTHSFLVAATVSQPMAAKSSLAFADAVRSGYLEQDPKSRFRTVRSFAKHYGEPGVYCAEFEATIQERDNPSYPGMILLMEQHGIACLHQSLKFIVRLETSERRPAGEPSFLDPTTRHEADAFLRSLVVDAYREAPSSPGRAPPVSPREGGAGSGPRPGTERWVQISEAGGVRVSIDASSVRGTGVERRASIKIDVPPHSIRGMAPAGPAFADKWVDFVVFQTGFKCVERLIRREAATGFFEDGSQAADRSTPFPQPWQPIGSEEWQVTALRLVCDISD